MKDNHSNTEHSPKGDTEHSAIGAKINHRRTYIASIDSMEIPQKK